MLRTARFETLCPLCAPARDGADRCAVDYENNSLSRIWRHVLPVRDEGRETPGLWSSKRVVHVCQLPPPTGPAARGPGKRLVRKRAGGYTR